MRGRKQTPVELKEIRGTARKDRINTSAPKFEKIEHVAAAPTDLSDLEKELYMSICNDLAPAGVIQAPDLMLIGRYVRLQIQALEAYAQVKKNGRILKTEKGYKTNPEFAAWLNLEKLLQTLGSDLGLSPAARSRIKMTIPEEEKPKKSEMESLLE